MLHKIIIIIVHNKKTIFQVFALILTDLSIIFTAIKKSKYAVITWLLAQPFWFLSLAYSLHVLLINQIFITFNWIYWIYNHRIKKNKFKE